MLPAALSLAFQALIRSATPSVAFTPTLRRSLRRTPLSPSIRRNQIAIDVNTVDTKNGALNLSHAAVAGPVLVPDAEKQDDHEFDWFKAWHPLLPAEILDRKKVIPMELLGMKLAVYNGGAKDAWRVVADPGWKRNEDGSLEVAPHVDLNSCDGFPAKIKGGMLFVWPVSGSDARVESELTPIFETFETETPPDVDKNRIDHGSWVFRRFPMSWDFLYENAIDAAHLEQAHHGSTANRYHKPMPSDITVTKKPTKNGFELAVKEKGGKYEFAQKFSAPGLLSINTSLDDDGSRHAIQIFGSPSSPGWINLSVRQSVIKTKDLKVPSTGRKARDDQIRSLRFPSFLTNIATNYFANQDVFDVILQERYMAEEGLYSAAKPEGEDPDQMAKVILATHADKSVLVFRKWIQNFSKGRIPYQGDLALPPIDKATAFNVFDQSTAYNAMSMDALKNSRNVRILAIVAAASVSILSPLGPIGNSALFAIFSGLALVAHKVVGGLTRIEYSAYLND